MPELRVTCARGQPFKVPLVDEVYVLGRARENQIVLADTTVSRRHAKLRKTPDGYLLMDLDSRNGTYVNGSTTKNRIMRHNDLVEIGATTLTYLDDASPSHVIKPSKSRVSLPVKKKTPPSKLLSVHETATGHEVLASIKNELIRDDEDLLPGFEAETRATGEIKLVGLEKSNKTLFVLYQLSRQLNRNPDFGALLKKALDLIFRVMEADYGFIVLLGPKPGQVIPKAVKHKVDRPVQKDPDLEINRTVLDRVVEEKIALLTLETRRSGKRPGRKGQETLPEQKSLVSVPLWLKDDVIGMIQVQSFTASKGFDKQDLDFLSTLSSQMAMIMEQAQLMEKVRREEILRNRLECFHPPEVVDLIMGWEGEDMQTILAPKEQTVTVLFVDIVNFSLLSERVSPKALSRLLNRYYGEVTDIMFSHNGTLDKYIGDAIMAVFGAPFERGNDAERAVLAALEARRVLLKMMAHTEPEKQFAVRLGINTGPVLAGNLGSPRRMDYTVIGDVVNIASRLESMAEPNQILIGNTTYDCVKALFKIRKLGRKTVKGKTQAVTVYEVLE